MSEPLEGMVATDNSTVLELLAPQKFWKLQFYNIYYKPANLKKEPFILKNVSGQFESGRLSAIIGPSGAGKTTLLNILSSFKCNTAQGTILVNNEEYKPKEFRKISSYIPQNFALLENLTVLESLQTSADLKLGRNTKQSKKSEIVQNIITLLNLEKCQNTWVGRLSGGERKRLSVGIELITNPPIMLFDEPTSGLDSVSSAQLIRYLRQLAISGRIIVCIIHQPNSRILKLFDDVLVLNEGHSLYNGPTEYMVDAFAKAGFVCPQYYNPADFALEVASDEHAGNIQALIDAEEKKFEGLKNTIVKKQENEDMFAPTKSRKYPVGSCEQFCVLVKRSFLSMSRDLMTVQLRVVCHVIVAFLLGLVYWDIGSDSAKILSNTSCLFFFILFIFFANSQATILSCTLETSVFLREHLNGWYSLRAYYFSKMCSDLPMMFSCPTLFSLIGYYLTGQPNDFGRFLMFWGICLLTAIHGHSVGLVAGAALPLTFAIFLVPVSCIPMLIFSGFFIRIHELSAYLQPLTYFSYFRYSLEGLSQSIYGYNRTGMVCSLPFCYYKPEKFLQDLDMAGDRYGIDVAALTGWIIFFYISLYATLFIKVRRAQQA